MFYYINIPNNTHYIGDNYKTHNRVVNPRCFSAQQGKQLSYYIRAYYHYLYVQSLGGLTFFYTLTYNNAALPHFYGIPTLDYMDVRYFLSSSGFSKYLLRNYGFRLQYLLTCELGEGKGSRGIAGNPHYHVLFFLIPDEKYILKAKSFNAQVFEDLVRTYWSGSDYKNVIPQNYKYGIAMAGDNYGVVNSPAALSYVSKYVLKDKSYYKHYSRLYTACRDYILNRLYKCRLFRQIYYKYYNEKYTFHNNPFVLEYVDRIYKNVYLKSIRNRYLPKVRISQGVGLSALENINPDGLTINIPHKRAKIKAVNLPLYLYRKKYYDVVKDGAGNNKYILNQSGIDLAISRFDSNIEKRFNNIKSIVNHYKPNLYNDIILRKYVEYDMVYRNRYQETPFDMVEVKKDYIRFLQPDYYSAPYSSDEHSIILKRKKFMRSTLYIYNAYFSELKNILLDLDNIIENHYICQSESQEFQFYENQKVKKLESVKKFNTFLMSC